MPAPIPLRFTPAVDCEAEAKLDARQPHPEKKKIFVFCDGTGNKFADSREGDGNSNVVKLYTALRVTNKQVAYYHPGVGTMGDPNIRHVIPRFWSKVKGLAFGAGFQANVLDAYRYLMEVYNDGDEIYLFGFSRGSYTARALAGMLYGYGLLCRGNEGHLLYAWNMFHDELQGKRNLLKKKENERKGISGHTIERDRAFAQTFSRDVTIRFMGIWDTVSSVGWIYDPVRLLDMAQNPIVQVGRHAVSIDERRAYYRDNLWGPAVDIDHPDWPEELRELGLHQDIAQVWFPGVHSDVGGSYPQSEAAPANEALRWMIGEVQKHGAELCQQRIDMVLGTVSKIYDADKIYTPAPPEDYKIHDSLKGFWWVLQSFPQQYYDKEDGKIQWRVPYGVPRMIPRDAIIHGSAIRRMEKTVDGVKSYSPRNLNQDLLRALDVPVAYTTANLEGCYVYASKDMVVPTDAEAVTPDSTTVRYVKLAVGWLTFGLFWVVVGAVAWGLVSFMLLVALLGVAVMVHTPGFKCLFKTALSWLSR
jgi:uncharacterized protein (DUF2235 family)